MTIPFTITQKERLAELSVSEEIIETIFVDEPARNVFFRKTEMEHARYNKNKIKDLLNTKKGTSTFYVERALTDWLVEQEGFTRVSTPTIIASKMLDQMTITKENPLREQVFWLDAKRCLRPMLAPNLYVVMRELQRIVGEPVKIFEVGSCFRKESQGALHMNEFTMLNFVELGSVKEGDQMDRLKSMAAAAMKTVGIVDYELVQEDSTVYGETLDIVVGGVEIASGSYGPHKLDANWGIFDTWVGLGIGIERIALVKGGYRNIKRVGRSITFVDGAPLNI